MHAHCRDQARVVNLFTQYLMLDDKLFPLRKDIHRVRQDTKEGFQPCQFSCGLRCGNSKSVVGYRSCGYSPKLDQILSDHS